MVETGRVPSHVQRESILREKGLRDRNSPTCTLSQHGYGEGQCFEGPLSPAPEGLGQTELPLERVLVRNNNAVAAKLTAP